MPYADKERQRAYNREWMAKRRAHYLSDKSCANCGSTDRLECDWWTGVTRVTDELYYGWPEGESHPWFWHWCTATNSWRGAGTSGHELVSREPLHLEPSLLWPCCGTHGFLRGDAGWIPA